MENKKKILSSFHAIELKTIWKREPSLTIE